MTLPPNTYGVRCEFNPGGTRYTYLVDEPHHGEINIGDHVVVASPKGGYKVILVVDNTTDLSPVNLKYMKYIVNKVETEFYTVLMHNLIGGPDSKVYGAETETDKAARFIGSPLIDEGDTDEPGDPREQNIQGLNPNDPNF